MQTRTIENYGKITCQHVAGKTLYKYLCKWIKTAGKRHYISGKAIIVAPDIDTAIVKAYSLRGYKPNLIQKI